MNKEYDVNNDPKEVSNIFNTFFIDMGRKLAESSNYFAKNYALNREIKYFFDSLFAIKIKNMVNNSKDDTGAGKDKITIKLLKCIIKLIVNPLHIICVFSKVFFQTTLKQQ